MMKKAKPPDFSRLSYSSRKGLSWSYFDAFTLRYGSWNFSSMLRFFILFVVTWAIQVNPLFADNRVAFVVGISKYEQLPAYRELRNSVNDAQAISRELGKLGFQIVNGENLTRSDFYDKWQNVLDMLKPDDTLALFFSGHGVEIDGHNYLLPSDIPYIKSGRSLQIARESISVSELLLDLRTGDRQPPRVTLMILDACRDDPLAPSGSKSFGSKSGLANMSPPEGTFIMYSAAAGQVALDRLDENDTNKYSVYTRTLLPLMQRRDLSLPDLAQELRRQVSELATTKADHKQQPAYFDQLKGKFCLGDCQDSWGHLLDLHTSDVYQLKGEKAEVGRDAKRSGVNADISFDNTFISRHHLIFRDNFSAEDLRSRNGTSVNGMSLPYGIGHKLEDGDIFSLANVKALQFSITRPSLTQNIPPNVWGIFINSQSRAYQYLSGTEYSLKVDHDTISVHTGNITEAVMRIRWQGKAEMLDVDDDWTVLMTVKDSDYDYKSYYITREKEWVGALSNPMQFVRLSPNRKDIVKNGPSFQLILFNPPKAN